MKKFLLSIVVSLCVCIPSCSGGFDSSFQNTIPPDPNTISIVVIITMDDLREELFSANDPNSPFFSEFYLFNEHECICEFYEQMTYKDPNTLLVDPNELVGNKHSKSYTEFRDEFYKPRMEKFKNIIIEEAEIPIFVMDPYLFNNLYFIIDENKPDFVLMGLFVPQSTNPKWPDQFIFINSTLNPYRTLSTFFHENQHYKCWRNKCKCFNHTNKWFREYHAIEAELREGVDRNLPECLQSSLGIIDAYCDGVAGLTYQAAASAVKRTKTYTEARELVKEWENKKITESGYVSL